MRSQPFIYSILAVAALGLVSNQAGAQQKSPSPADMVKAAGAKPTPHTPDGHPDLNGIWRPSRRGEPGRKRTHRLL
jgi:hypothetical protein